MTIVDLGAGENPDPRATVTTDIVDLHDIDLVFDLEEETWPLDTNSAEGIVARHVFEHLRKPQRAFAECARILKPGGWLEVHVPIGLDARTDPTHEREWTWETAEYFTRDPPYNYGWDLPFELEDREIEWWIDGPHRRLAPILRLAERIEGQSKWLSGVPGLSGILIARYHRLE